MSGSDFISTTNDVGALQPGANGELPARRVVVIGGGVAGLTAAYKLTSAAERIGQRLSVTLVEANGRLGGVIMTYKLHDMIIDLGPDMFLTEKQPTLDLISELGITRRMLATNKEHQRTFVASGGKLRPLPSGFYLMAPTRIWPFLCSNLLSVQGKLRVLKDLLIPAAPADADESLSQFVTRRLGAEAFERIVQPLIGGIFTADPNRLSVKAALPRIWKLEQQYGSLIKGLSATRRKQQGESGARYGLFASFDNGLQELIDTLEKKFSGNVMLNTIATDITRNESNGFSVHLSNGTRLNADGVIIAAPAFHAANLVASLDPTLSAELAHIEYASAAVVHWLLRRDDIPHPLNGFGFVVPASEKHTIMACSFSSVKFPGRIPEDSVLLRMFVGGALRPDVYQLTDEQLECLIWQDLHTLLGIKSIPIASIMSRYPRSMPQYNLGHVNRVARIEQAVAAIPGLALAGNAYYGVGIPDCVESAARAVDQVCNHLTRIAERN